MLLSGFVCIILLLHTQTICSQKVDKLHGRDYSEATDRVHGINDRSKKYMKSFNDGFARLQNYDLLSTEALQDVSETATEALREVQNNTDNISTQCLDHFILFLEGLGNGDEWAARMVDAMGKPESGLFDLHLIWLGSWEECTDIEAVVYEDPDNKTGPSYPFTGKYCLASFVLGENPSVVLRSPVLALSIGMCFPSTCSTADATIIVQILESLLLANITDQPPVTSLQCQPTSLGYTGGEIAVLVVCSIFLALLAVSTLYDVIFIQWQNETTSGQSSTVKKSLSCNKHSSTGDGRMIIDSNSDRRVDRSVEADEETPLISSDSDPSKSEKPAVTEQQSLQYKPGRLGMALLSFSAITNASKVLSTNPPPGTLTAVNGIRFISMTWVILGHTYSTGMYILENAFTYIPKVTGRLTFQAIGNATFSVDTFFVLSGLLVSYLSLKEMKKVGGMFKFRWGMFYFHRFWRLTPPYMLVLMVYTTLMSHFADGPMWPSEPIESCNDTWWKNLLYVNNLVEPEKMCMGWSWYLANDMQFFVISPIMLIPLYYSPLWGGISCLTMILVNFISAGLISKHYKIDANMLLGEANGDSFNELYIKPWCRVGAYTVGVFTGYLLYKTDCKVKMPKLVNMIGWLVATALALLILYGLWSPDNEEFLSVDAAALYNATSRTVWGACICWVVFACATGYGGPVNKLLSWPALIPLSRLTYCAYLVHPVLMVTYYLSQRNLSYWYNIQVIVLFMGLLSITYAVAFVVTLAFESPMMGLEKAIFGREKNS